MIIRACARALLAAVLGCAVPLHGAAEDAPDDLPDVAKLRLLLLTDIGNEPDDAESFVRFLLYANQFDVEALVATTSTWQRTVNQPQLLRERVEAYGRVLPNLSRHARGYPEPEQLLAVISAGIAEYGMNGVGAGKDTAASRAIIEAADRADPRPIYVPIWGGAVDLAQALWSIRASRSPEQVAAFVAKLRVYSISDQDDAGPWIRRNFPDLFWIGSVHGWNQYGMAAWTGISGDLNRTVKWPAAEMVTNAWLARHVRRGPLGKLYPPHVYIMEGDTPSFLGLIANGLNVPEHPEFGGWGGRYVPAFEGSAHRADAIDNYVDEDGVTWTGNQATIFRWRRAFQNDFAARIAWTLTPDFAAANHSPRAVLNGIAGIAPVTVAARSGETVRLSAAGSSDPDGDGLSYLWRHYPEPGSSTPGVSLVGADTAEAHFSAPTSGGPFHVILEVTDSGEPTLTSYRRALVEIGR
jgi:hypothetical protein